LVFSLSIIQPYSIIKLMEVCLGMSFLCHIPGKIL
jgi:hypothetical protein